MPIVRVPVTEDDLQKTVESMDEETMAVMMGMMIGRMSRILRLTPKQVIIALLEGWEEEPEIPRQPRK